MRTTEITIECLECGDETDFTVELISEEDGDYPDVDALDGTLCACGEPLSIEHVYGGGSSDHRERQEERRQMGIFA